MKTFYVTLSFKKGSDFSSTEDAANREAAIEQTKRWARGCGWTGPIVKISAVEVSDAEVVAL